VLLLQVPFTSFPHVEFDAQTEEKGEEREEKEREREREIKR
jgi:hypothetical protein